MEDSVQERASFTAIMVENSALVKSFSILFETLWEKANDYCIIDNQRILQKNLNIKQEIWI
jgi:hypothetical protein